MGGTPARARACAALVVGLGSALVAAGCGGGHPLSSPPPPVVSVAPVVQRDVPVHTDYVGTLDAYVNADARARVQGILLEQHFTEGSTVKAGQLLFVIDPKPFEAAKLEAEGALAQAKAALAKAEADVARDTPLVAKQAVSQQDLDNAIAARASAIGQVASAQGQLDTARLNLGYTRITSPVDGIAGIAQVRIGNLVGQGEPTLLASVSDVDPIRVVLSLPEREYIGLAERIAEFERFQAQGGHGPDEPALQLILADGSVYRQTGRFAIVGAQVNPATGTLTVQALFPNPDQTLRPGQYARVRMNEDVKQAVVIPQRAVAQTQDQQQVAVIGPDNHAELRQVKLGQTSGAFVIVDDGLKPDAQIVIDGIAKVRAGQPVMPKPADTSMLQFEAVAPEIEKGKAAPPSPPRGVTAPQPSGSAAPGPGPSAAPSSR
jgi:membrane fusion protein, multidrug efflux system